MEMDNKEPLEQILNFYPINVTSIKLESYKDKKGVWWIRTPNGSKILKKISNSEDTLKHILFAIKHLSLNGVLIPGIIKTRFDTDYVNLDGTCYVLSDAIEGKNPGYQKRRFKTGNHGFGQIPSGVERVHPTS